MNYEKLGFRVGSIYRVRMYNFLTFDECEVFPGPKLNVVIGPNGTGKSTLTHAICLACCGSTGDVGRAPDLKKFVKNGKENCDCFVEIDLVTSHNTVTTIRRSINVANNSSKWLMNGQMATQSRVKETVHGLKIDVDNLCSFMPQDKVGKFTLYTPKEILQNTLKSISGASSTGRGKQAKSESSASANSDINDEEVHDENNLHKEQIELSSIEETKETYRRDRDATEKKLQDISRELTMLSSDLDRLKKKDRAKELKQFYEIKLLKLRIDIAEEEKTSLEEQHNQKAYELEDAKKLIAPLEKEIRKLRQDLQLYEKEETEINQQNQRAKQGIDKLCKQIEEEDVSIEKAKQEIESFQLERENLELKYEQLNTEYKNLSERVISIQKQKAEWEDSIKSHQQDKRDKMELKQHKKEELDDLHSQLQRQKEMHAGTNREISQLQNPNKLFKDRLVRFQNADGGGGGGVSKMFRDTVAAMEWLDRNMETLLQQHQLKEPVYGPLGMLCTVKNPACAMMIERVIPMNRLLGLIVTNDDDANLLKRELRTKLKLDVDIFTMKNVVSVHSMSRPYGGGFLESLKSHGIVGYLADELQCPEIIKSFLFQFQSLHTVLWGNTDTDLSMDVLKSLCTDRMHQFRLFIHDPSSVGRSRGGVGTVTEYAGKKSRYAPNAAPSIVSSIVQSRGLINTGDADNSIETKRKSLEQTLHGQVEEMKKVEKSIQTLDASYREMDTQIFAISQEVENLKRRLQQETALIRKQQEIQKQRNEIKKSLSVDVEAEKGKILKNMTGSITSMIVKQEQLLKLSKDAYPYSMKLSLLSTIYQSLQEQLQQKDNELVTKKAALQTIQNQMNELKKLVAKKNSQMEKQIGELEEIAQKFEDFVETIFPKILELCKENTVEELENKIFELEAQIKAIVDNPQLFIRFEQLSKEEVTIKTQLAEQVKKYTNIEEDLQARADAWRANVRSIAKKLNASFQQYMRALSFDGEVALREVGKFIDFEMILKVSFRKEGSLVELSGSRHSGGERAVSTIMYLMALQDMTCSPFRVVDEINQGMDERNERLVVDRIVRSCTTVTDEPGKNEIKDNSTDYMMKHLAKPQYFLVTPKLLQGLTSLNHPDVTILLIWNGPGVQHKWKFHDILLRLRSTGNAGTKRSRNEYDGEDLSDTEGEMSVKPLQPKKISKNQQIKNNSLEQNSNVMTDDVTENELDEIELPKSNNKRKMNLKTPIKAPAVKDENQPPRRAASNDTRKKVAVEVIEIPDTP